MGRHHPPVLAPHSSLTQAQTEQTGMFDQALAERSTCSSQAREPSSRPRPWRGGRRRRPAGQHGIVPTASSSFVLPDQGTGAHTPPR